MIKVDPQTAADQLKWSDFGRPQFFPLNICQHLNPAVKMLDESEAIM